VGVVIRVASGTATGVAGGVGGVAGGVGGVAGSGAGDVASLFKVELS